MSIQNPSNWKRLFMGMCFLATILMMVVYVYSFPSTAEPEVAPPSEENQSSAKNQANSQPSVEFTIADILTEGREILTELEKVEGYSAQLQKQERVEGTLLPTETIQLKIQHEPFSVYLDFESPASLKEREVIYIEGENKGSMLVHSGGLQDLTVGTLQLSPTGTLAMMGNRYPITSIGFKNLLGKVLTFLEEHQKDLANATVSRLENVRLADQSCICFQIDRPAPNENCSIAFIRLYIDQKLKIPVGYEAFEWETKPELKKLLVENYIYSNVTLNPPFTDQDFSTENPDYKFP